MKKKLGDFTIREWKDICKKHPYGICRNCPFFKVHACPSSYLKPDFDEKLERDIEDEDEQK